MPRLLYIEASPRKTFSVSMETAHVFLHAYASLHPTHELDVLDLWSEPLPEYNAQTIGSKYKAVSGETMEPAEEETWARVHALIDRFKQADKFIFGVPMWNFGIPYKLKHLIDLVSQRDHLFTFDGKHFGPLLENKQALVIYARGQDYASPATTTPASTWDYQQPYFDFWLRFIGITNIQTITVENTWGEGEREARRFGRTAGATAAAAF